MRKIRLGIWILGVGVLLFFSRCCPLLVPEMTYNRDKAKIEQFDPAGVWVRQDGNCCSNFYFQLTEKGSCELETRYTVYYRETDVVPYTAEDFRRGDILSTRAFFSRAPYLRGLTLCMADGTGQRPSIRLQPLDRNHVLLIGDERLEGIYTRRGSDLSWHCYSDWHLTQLYRWADLQGML